MSGWPPSKIILVCLLAALALGAMAAVSRRVEPVGRGYMLVRLLGPRRPAAAAAPAAVGRRGSRRRSHRTRPRGAGAGASGKAVVGSAAVPAVEAPAGAEHEAPAGADHVAPAEAEREAPPEPEYEAPAGAEREAPLEIASLAASPTGTLARMLNGNGAGEPAQNGHETATSAGESHGAGASVAGAERDFWRGALLSYADRRGEHGVDLSDPVQKAAQLDEDHPVFTDSDGRLWVHAESFTNWLRINPSYSTGARHHLEVDDVRSALSAIGWQSTKLAARSRTNRGKTRSRRYWRSPRGFEPR